MYAYDSGSMVGSGEATAIPVRSWPRSFTGKTAVAPSGGYGAHSGPNWAAIGAIAAVHVLALVAVIKLDVLHIVKPKPEPLVVNLLAEPPAPPPQSKEKPKPQTQVQPAIVAPAPIVQTSTPPPIVMTAPTAPPRPVTAAPPAPPPPAPVAATNLDDSVIEGKPPRYPIDSRRNKEQGTVTLRLTIGTNGYVSEISIARSSGFDRLDSAALHAVRGWRWRPMIRDGQPVEVTGVMQIPFKLEG